MTVLPDSVTPLRYQRRIARRYPVQMTLTCSPVERRHWRRRPGTCRATTANVSLTGIGFETDALSDIERGSAVTITIGEARCTAAVRFTQPGTRLGSRYFGIEITDSQMMDTLQRAIDDYRGAPAARR